MSCISYDVEIKNDKTGKLKKVVEELSDGVDGKKMLLASYFESTKFQQYVEAKVGKTDINELQYGQVRKLVNDYFNENNHWVESTANRRQGGAYNFGFTDISALRTAKDHTANLIVSQLFAATMSGNDISTNKIAKNVISQILNNFFNIYAKELYDSLDENHEFKKQYKEFIEKVINENKEARKQRALKMKVRKDLKGKDEETIAKKKKLTEEINKLNNKIAYGENGLFNLFKWMCDHYGNNIHKNYANLAFRVKINPNEWFEETFTISGLIKYKRDFENTINDENIEIDFTEDDHDSFTNTENNSENLESRRWVDEIDKNTNFTQLTETDVKLYLATIKVLNSTKKKIIGDEEFWDYDTNNPLKTTTTMGADYILLQLSNIAAKDSVSNFIRSIKQAAQQIKGLEGLMKLAEDLEKNPVLANRIFSEVANPAIAKSIIDVSSEAFDHHISNAIVDPTTYIYYNFQQSAKFTINDAYDSYDSYELNNILNNLKPGYINARTINTKYVQNYDAIILRVLAKYFPKVDNNAVINYLHNDTNGDITNNYIKLVSHILDFNNQVIKLIEKQNKLIADHNKRVKAWREASEFDEDFSKPKPVFDSDSIPYEILDQPLIKIAQLLTPFTAVRNELNSFNAEGNMGSDLIGNNYITNFLKDLNYATPEDEFAGLRHLGQFVYNVPQYEKSPIFWGVRDNRGKIVIPGLFIKKDNGFDVNPDAKKLISLGLFNGIRNIESETNALYTTMSKGDYFLSNVIAFHNPALSITQRREADMGGFFLRTPSDAPKNFTINSKIAHIYGLFEPVIASRDTYLNESLSNLIAKLNIQNTLLAKGISYNTNNKYSIEEVIDLINNLEDSFNYTGYASFKLKDNIYVPIKVEHGKEHVVIYLTGDVEKGSKSKVLNNVKIHSTYVKNGTLSDNIINEINRVNTIIGTENGSIETVVNQEHGLFLAFKQHLYTELYNLIYNLNNVFEETTDTKGNVEYVLKSNFRGLFDRYHMNDGTLVKDGKLTGNVFSLNRLFTTNNGVNVGAQLLEAIGLYGKKNSIINNSNPNKLKLNRNNPFLLEIEGQIVLAADAVDSLLNKFTAEWIQNFTNDIRQESQQYKTIIEDRYSQEQINDALLNAALMEMNLDDLFEGDSKFYKDTRDFFKRAKEIQASGKAYAGFNLDSTMGASIMPIMDANNNPTYFTVGETQIPIKNGFVGATIKNTIRVSDNAENIYKELLNLNQDLPDSTRKRIAYQIARGFGYDGGKPTKTNDAQSYITVEEWIRRRYLDGTINKYKDILPYLLDKDADITKIDIAKINKFVQVQKNFYFDKQLDTSTNTMYARQIKNAEFVLIPALIKGTSLEKLYNIMKERGVDQINTVETDKAAKRVILEFWDNNGHVSDVAADKFSEDLLDVHNKEDYYYRYLYKQQDVAQHMQDMMNKAGIQIMKKILDNADPAMASNIDKFFNNYVANIKTDFKTFLHSMGWRYEEDETGNIIIHRNTTAGLDFTKFYKRAKDEAARLGLDSNFLDYLTTDMFGNTIMPNYMNIASVKLESIAQAMFNSSITRQKLPGWHAAQITNVGYDSNLKYHNGYIKKDNPTSDTFISDEDYAKLSSEEQSKYQKCAYAEVRIPRWSKNIPKVKPGSQEEKDLIANLEKEGLDLHIGYRIPTEGKQSISILKVVGFLDDVQGSTIVVPDEWVTQTGSDFDVDSVYGINFEIDVQKDGYLKKVKEVPGTGIDSVKLRYRNKLNADIKELLRKDKRKVFIDLSTDEYEIKNANDIKKLLATNAGINFLCDRLGLITFEDFAKLSYEEQQSKAARNNNILQAMIDILQNASSREENYIRSHFEDLTNDKDEIDELRSSFYGQADKVESTYNPIDQITFQENAMSGYSLKATSVNRDTFNSVNNYVRGKLNNDATITITYDLNAKDRKGNLLYYREDIINAYGADAHDNGNGTITVSHRMYGHSLNNRNIKGLLITAYSAQTTAHILDAIKEGSIFNENMYTFGAFKILLDVGTDYRTAIAFLQQPAITEVVNAYNETNSVYTQISGNPIYIAINRIANRLGIMIDGNPITDNTSIYSTYEALTKNELFQLAIMKLTGGQFTENGNIDKGLISLDSSRLIKRFNQADKNGNYLNYNVELAAEDICNILFFAKLRDTANKIEKVRQCTNPDRFGAKQSIFATRRIVKNINKYITDEKNVGNIIEVNGKSILEAIYPNITTGNIDVESSAYKYLAAFMKYSTMQSIDINKQLFKLESDDIYQFIEDVQATMGIEFNDEQAKTFQQYIINDLYNSIEVLHDPFIVNDYGFFEPISKDIYGNENDIWSNEIDRLNGYVNFSLPGFKFENITNPKQDELIEWALLSPVQKIIYITNNFDKEHIGIFKYLNVNHWKGKDIIKYNDTLGDIETLFTEFADTFFNKNPILQMAALDLIKYAFLVEGFRFKKGGISKIVPNDCIIADVQHKGLDLLNQFNNAFVGYQNMANDLSKSNTDNFIDKFVRSHATYMRPIYVGKKIKNTFNDYIENSFVNEGMFAIPIDDSESSKTIFNKLGVKFTYNGKLDTNKRYIVLNRKIGKKRKNVLYKLKEANGKLYGIPLNYLEEHETSNYSYNNDNNVWRPVAYYDAVIQNQDTTGFEIPKHVKIDNDNVVNLNKISELFERGTTLEHAAADKIIKDVQAYFTSPVEGQGDFLLTQVQSPIIKAIIPHKTVRFQYLPINKENKLFKISRYNLNRAFYDAIKDKKNAREKLTYEENKLVDEVKRSGIVSYITVYQIVPASKIEQDIIEGRVKVEYEEDEDEVFSVMPLINEQTSTINHQFDSIDQVAKDAADSIFRDHSQNKTESTKTFVEAMNDISLDRRNTDSVHNNRKEIYHEAAVYYEKKAAIILDDINNISITDEEGHEYHITDDKFYKFLEEHPEVYNHLTKLILEAYNFGKQFNAIYQLDLQGEDEALNKDIEKLKTVIRKVTDNNIIKNAMANIYDKYLADMVSTNPNIRHGLINLRQTFGDTDWWDAHFSDIGFINNNQVQVVVKYINSKLNAVTRFTVPKLIAEFVDEYDEIIRKYGDINMDHVVVDGKIVKDFIPEYLAKRRELINKVNEARDTYGIASLEYWKAKLEKDDWFADNVEQEMIRNYYIHINNNLRKVLEEAPEEFIEYQKLRTELQALGNNYKELSYDQLLKRKELLTQLSHFTSTFNEDGTEKSIVKQEKLKAIKAYKQRLKELNNEYFDTTVVEEIQNKINEFANYIKEYDRNNITKTLEEKLKDDKYKEAYDWLQANTTYDIDTESNEKLLEAYAKFRKGESDKLIRISGILKGKDVYRKAPNGELILDPRKISLEDMKKIKELYETDQTKYYEEDNAEYNLILPFSRKRIIGTEDYYSKIISIIGENTERNKAKDRLVKKINSYLLKGIDDNGEFDIKLLFQNCTEEELKQLAQTVRQYSLIENIDTLDKYQIAELGALREEHVVTDIFRSHENWAKNNLTKTQLDLFYKIFAQRYRDDGRIYKNKNGKVVPSYNFYRFTIPSDENIDREKTDAINFINENIEYEIIPEYIETRDKYRSLAAARGDANVYAEWFKVNHIYNSYTHRYEPLNIWKKRRIKPGGSLNATYEYNPAYEHTLRVPKDYMTNDKYDANSYENYNSTNGYYANPFTRTKGEIEMANLFQRVLNAQAGNKKLSRMAKNGFMPRRAKIEKDKVWYARQAAATLGLDWVSYRERKYSHEIDYATDREGDFNMASMLRKKGTIDIKSMVQEANETDEQFAERVKEAKENNAAIDKAIMDKDWKSVMQDFIEKATIYNAKEELKDTALLLIEDLKHTEADRINHMNRVSMSKKRSTSHNDVANTEKKLNTIDVVETWYRRVFRNEFKKKHRYNEFASLMQNVTSSKYMIFNVTGGIANVWTGTWNIIGESLAQNHFNNKEFGEAVWQYQGALINYFSEMYSETSSNLTNALIKRFNVIDYEEMSERRPDESAAEYIKRFRNWMYGLQSGGEHFMQNCAMLAMLKSHRIYQDDNGKNVIGSYQNYIWEVERQALKEIINKDNILKDQYESFIKEIKNNKEELYKLETLREDLNVKFLRALADDTVTKEYIKLKKQKLKDAEDKFKTFPTLESKFELKKGYAVLKDDSVSDYQLGAFTDKVIYVNKEIHGVYDKIGAAVIEREWWGSLVMQYHKHLYPGVMKRFRLNGYYNEHTESQQKGSYISAINLLTIDFDKAFKVAKDDADGQKILQAVKGVQNISRQIVSNIVHIQTNWALLPQWERNNVKKALADQLNMLSCIVMAIGIHTAWDEDEIKDSNVISTGVYLANRFFAEAAAYTPWGAIAEAKTLYSSPIAATNQPQDIIKFIGITGQMLFDPDFESKYSTGLYKGRYKHEVLITRNIPGIRIYNRLNMMSKNNQYYRLNSTTMNFVPVATIGDYLAGRN